MFLRPDSNDYVPTFVTMPDSSVTLLTLPDVGWLPEFEMTAITSGFLEFR